MNAIEKSFDFGGRNVRVEMTDGKPWFVAQDVATILEYSATSAMTRRLEADDKGVRNLHTLGGVQQLSVISEAGLYVAIFGSQAAGASAFKRKVTHEILPEIRRTGKFNAQTALPSTRQLALMVIEAEDARATADQRAAVAEARADATQLIIDNVERKDGLVVRAWLKKYFPPRQEHRLWDLFYSRNLLKDGRGQGGTDRRGKPKASRDHQSVYTDGQAFFIRTERDYQVGDGVTRYETRVRPGRAELELVAYCQRAGIEPLPEVAQALAEIQDLSAIFNAQKELAA